MTDDTKVIAKKKLRKRILEHLLGPVGSVIFHILLIASAIKFLGMVREARTPEIEVQVMELEAVELEEFEQELEQIEELQDMTEAITPPDVSMDQPPDVQDTTAPSEDIDMDMTELSVVQDFQSPLVMKGLFGNRSASGRSSGLRLAGRWAEDTERSVIKALEWLKRNQAPDGSWGPNKPAMTGLGLLTFLAHGETTSSEKYGATVEKAIRFLVQAQQDNGAFDTISQQGVYAHGIATYAISEAYGLTRIPSLKSVMERAVQVIIDGQQPGGSWDYKYDKGARRDTSVAGWQIQALKAAYIAGAENGGIKPAMDKAVEDLKSVQHPETGMFSYGDLGRGNLNMTGVAVLCLQMLGEGSSGEVKSGLQALKDADVNWTKPMNWPMYAWYYITQAKFHAGGPSWVSWNNEFAKELTRNQNEDGSWTSAGQHLEGEGHGKEVNHGPVYATTLAALTLQVYYRFLPTYKPIEVEEEKGPAEDDVTIEII